MRDQKKTKSGLVTLVALTLMMLAVALSFFLATLVAMVCETATL